MHEMQYYYQEYFCLRTILNNNLTFVWPQENRQTWQIAWWGISTKVNKELNFILLKNFEHWEYLNKDNNICSEKYVDMTCNSWYSNLTLKKLKYNKILF